MRRSTLPIAAGFCLMATAASAAPAPAKTCVRFDALEQIHRATARAAVATTRRAAYMVTFLGDCTAMSGGAFFIIDRVRVGECLDAGDVLDTSDGIACTVGSVSELPPVAIKNGPK